MREAMYEHKSVEVVCGNYKRLLLHSW